MWFISNQIHKMFLLFLHNSSCRVALLLDLLRSSEIKPFWLSISIEQNFKFTVFEHFLFIVVVEVSIFIKCKPQKVQPKTNNGCLLSNCISYCTESALNEYKCLTILQLVIARAHPVTFVLFFQVTERGWKRLSCSYFDSPCGLVKIQHKS